MGDLGQEAIAAAMAYLNSQAISPVDDAYAPVLSGYAMGYIEGTRVALTDVKKLMTG